MHSCTHTRKGLHSQNKLKTAAAFASPEKEEALYINGTIHTHTLLICLEVGRIIFNQSRYSNVAHNATLWLARMEYKFGLAHLAPPIYLRLYSIFLSFRMLSLCFLVSLNTIFMIKSSTSVSKPLAASRHAASSSFITIK